MSVHFHEFAGTPLREDDFRQGRVLTQAGVAGAAYSWDVGIAIGHYLEELRRGHLVGRGCARCGRVLFPPRMFCEQCFCPTAEWVTLPDTGTIQTFAISHIAWDASRIPEPKMPAVIAIDGASRHMGLLHLIGGVKPDDVSVGQRVRAVWKPARERRGAITDIRFFAPMEE